jgi:predicted nucleotidyltransferase
MMKTAATPTSTRDTAVLPDIISEEFLSALRANGARRAFLFGSFARGEATPSSDVDLLVEFDQPKSLFDELRLAERLQQLCGHPVDLMSDIHPAFAPYIVPTMLTLPL